MDLFGRSQGRRIDPPWHVHCKPNRVAKTTSSLGGTMTMTRTIFALLPSLSLVACAVQTGDPTGTEEQRGQATEELRTRPSPPATGADCHAFGGQILPAGSGPVTGGTMIDGWCCGYAKCID